MRLHRLSVQAFGPFAGSEQVDLDALAADGLFLLHGRTGAGKTSVLDAVCFALYGAVPGARAAAAPDLRSHHAAPDLPPVVELELTVGGRRLRVERSPAWQRPKRRGEGTTTEQARTLLSEHAPDHPEAGDDGWRPLSSRNDEAAQLVTDLLGMGLAQFATVVLLPQGQFAAFLRSGVAERRALLQHLFATDRFERAERWLVAERTRSAAALERATAALVSTAERAEHTAAEWAPAPPEGNGDEAGGLGGLEQLVDRVAQLAGAVSAAAASAEAHRSSTASAAREAQAHEHAARTTADRAQRRAELGSQRRVLLQAERGVAAQRTELAAAAAAAGLAGHLHAARTADAVLHAATTRAGAAAAHLAEVAGAAGTPGAEQEPATSQHLRERAAEHRREQGRLSELVALESDLVSRQAQAREVAAEHERVHVQQQRVVGEREQHALRRTDLAEQLGAHADRASLAPAAAAALEEAERLLEHARAADALGVRHATAAEGTREAAQTALEARATWLDARQVRLDGVAAELAARLLPGAACPVCGACEHPAPAAPPDPGGAAGAAGSGSSAAAAEDAAQQRWDLAEAAATSAQQRLDDLRREVVAARARAGDLSTAEAAGRVEDARVRAAAAASAAALVERLTTQLADVEAADAAAVRAQGQVAASLARLGERAEQLAVGLARDSARLEGARDGEVGLAERSARLAALADAAEELATATEAEATARTSAQAARETARGAATAAGFTDLAAAVLAERPAGVRRHLEQAVAEHERARERVQAQLEELGAADPADPADPSEGLEDGLVDGLVAALDGARREREEADAAADAAVRAAERARSAAQVLERLEVEVRDRAAAARPLAVAAEVTGDLARCAEGTGGGNTRRMKLSTFVLAARLEQVAVSASERLEVMSDGRYRLVHTDALERRGAGSGLGLRVLDAWTGVERDVATLSGGETFMASLALALGLADVVRAEGGGTPVETLFVDEGFGTLDPESLEEVMGVLEQLRAGGRAVGLVSHVPELRTRVPARLEVLRTATGSRLRTVLG